MSRHQLSDLIDALAVDGDIERARPPRLAFPDQVLATILRLRVALAAEPLTVLFDSSRTAMHRTLLKISALLKAHSIVVSPAATPPAVLRPHSPPGSGASPQWRPQQHDQDNVLVILQALR